MPDKAYPVAPRQGSLEEGPQTDPLRVLFWLRGITVRPESRRPSPPRTVKKR